MNRKILLYWALLLATVTSWLCFNRLAFFELKEGAHFHGIWLGLLFYLGSHVLRVFRLILLTLDQRSKILDVSLAHIMTSFPNVILPFKIGEVLRVMAFFRVFDGEWKALAVWLVERFGDICIIATFIVSLYFFDISIPEKMQFSFVAFVVLSSGILVSAFTFSKVFIYLKQYLVLTSITSRGLILLRISHAFRLLWRAVQISIEGRFFGFIFLSLLIWIFEVISFAFFVDNLYAQEGGGFIVQFVMGLYDVIAGGNYYINIYSAFGVAIFSFLSLSLILLKGKRKVEEA